jgi:uncharacterized protein VirK/YbjX
MTIRATRDDVIQCYRNILNREPESEVAVINNLSGAPTLWELVRRFIDSQEFRLHNQKTSAFSLHKLSVGSYLALSIGDHQKYRCFMTNYSFLTELFQLVSFQKMLYQDIQIFQVRPAEIGYTVTMQISREIHNEGEISLYFRAEREPLYILSFTIVPGDVVHTRNRHVILVSRMQGWGGKLAAIQRATKTMNDTSPQAVLFAGLQGLAQAMGIAHIAGTRATNQVCYYDARAALFEGAYDGFFLSVGASDRGHGFFGLNVPAREKPLAMVKPGHRLRTKVKRAFKRDIARSINAAILPMLAASRGAYPVLVGVSGGAD